MKNGMKKSGTPVAFRYYVTFILVGIFSLGLVFGLVTQSHQLAKSRKAVELLQAQESFYDCVVENVSKERDKYHNLYREQGERMAALEKVVHLFDVERHFYQSRLAAQKEVLVEQNARIAYLEELETQYAFEKLSVIPSPP